MIKAGQLLSFVLGPVLAAVPMGCRSASPVAPPAVPESAVAAPSPKSVEAVPVRRKTGWPAADTLTLLLRSAGRTVEVVAVRGALAEVQESSVILEEALVQVARRQGLWAHAQYGTPALLRERLAAGVPVLVQVEPPRERPDGAFVVVTAYHPNRNMFRVLNARGQAVDQAEHDLLRDWAAMHFWMMTACRPERGRWDLTPLEHLSRMQAYDAAGRYDRGDADAARALVKGGRNPDVYVALGARERARGRPEAAEDLWRRALARDPQHVRAANNLAYLLAEKGRNLEEAEQLARGAARVEPTNPRVLHTVGFVLQARGRPDEALVWLERAWKQAGAETLLVRREIGLQLVRVYRSQQRKDEADRLLHILRQQEPGLLVPLDVQDVEP